MKRLEVAINVLLVTAVVALACAGIWIWREQTKIYTKIKREIEVQATQALGLPVEVGTIEGLWWKNLVVRDVRIRGHAGKGAPTAVYVPEIKARYSIPEILKLGRKPVELEVVGPVVTLARDAKGIFSVRPNAEPAEPPGELPKLPIIHVVVRDGTIDWLDSFQATSSQTVPFSRRIPLDHADLTLRKGVLTWNADLRDATAKIHARGRHDVDRGAGDASLRASGVGLPDWAGYGAPSDDYRILAGAADAVAAVTYDLEQTARTKVGGQVWIRDLTLSHKDLPVPVEKVQVEAAFDLAAVKVRRISADVLGNVIAGAGTVDIRDPKIQKLDLRFDIPSFDLADAAALVPELTPFGISGTAGAIARVHGSALDPEIDVAARIAHATALKETLGPGTAKAHVHHMKAEISDIALAVHGGQATGNFWFTLDQAPRVGGRIAFDGVGLGPAAAPFLPRPLPLFGRLAGIADISGPMEALMISGDATLREAGIGRQPVDSGSARFSIYRGNTTVSELVLTAPDGGRLTGDVGWNDGGDLVLALAATDFDLRALRRGGLDVDLAGKAQITLDAAGNMLAPDTLEASGRIVATDCNAWGQPISDVAGDYRLAAGRLELGDIVGHTASALVTGKGVVAPVSFERELPPPEVSFDFDAVGLDLGQVPEVQKAAAEPLGGLVGRLSAYGVRLRVVRGELAIGGSIDATDVAAPRVGSATALSGQVDLVGDRLSLADVLITQGPPAEGPAATGSATVSLAGEVALGAKPILALHVRTTGADARTLLGSVHWRRLLQGTWIVRRGEDAGVQGPARPYAQLPDRERFEIDPDEPLDFSAIYNHWLGAKREPLISDEGQLEAAKPFWEAIDGVVDAEIRLDGPATDPYIFAETDVRGARVYGHALKTASMLAWYGHGELAVDHLDLEAAEGGSVHAGGALGSGRSLEVTAADLELAWLNPWLQAADLSLSGLAGGRIVASGELGRPRLDISAAAKRGHISDFIYDKANAEAILENGQLTVRECALEKDGKEARIAGALPIGMRPEETDLNLTLDVRGQGLGIVSVLSKGLIDWRGGDGTLHVDIIGTQADPRLRGVLKLQGARIAVKTLEGEISDIFADAQIGAGIVKVERVTARYGGGRMEANGYITLKQFKFENYFLDVWMAETDVRMANGLYEGHVDGHVRVGGKFERPSITGELTVSKGRLELNAAQGGGGGPSEPGTPIDLSGLNLNIKDTTSVVQANLMDVRVQGNLIVNGSALQPDFKGLVNVVPGGTITTFYTNTFKVEEGSTVEFLGSGRPSEESDLMSEILGEDRSPQGVATAVPNARVRILASTTVTDYENLHPDPGEVREAAGGALATHKPKTVTVKATITGSLTDLKFTFQSDPPSYTQAEVETLLGKPGAITGIISALAPRATDSADTGSSFRTISREVGYGAFNFFAKQWLKTALDPVLGIVLSDYGVDLIGDPNRSEQLLTGFNLGLSFQTKSIGPFSASYRRVVNTSRAQGQGDTKRYGVNMLGIPLNIPLSGTVVDWLTPTAVIQDLGVTTFLEDTAGSSNEFPYTFDEFLSSSPANPWRASIQIGIRGRL